MIDIKLLREQLGMTQTELAERCGVSLRTVQYWEKGEHIPDGLLCLLELINSKPKGSIVSNAQDNAVSVVASSDSNVNVNHSDETTRELLTIIKRKDEQIDALIKMMQERGGMGS